KKDQKSKNKKDEQQYKVELHLYGKNIEKNAKNETKNATVGMSHYERNKDKRKTRKAEARARGSKDAWTATNSQNSARSSQNSTVVSFPNQDKLEGTEQQSEMQKQFSTKIKNRRRNRESME